MLLPQDNIYIQGDTIKLSFQLWKDKENNLYWDLTNTQIRFQLNTTPIIKKATANVPGGSSLQITILNVVEGLFTINILKTETGVTTGDYTFEIEVTEQNGERYTVLQGSLRILEEYIAWSSI